MREVIMEKLREIALKEDVKILYAAESGSRAWGFDSPDSDYDVRFIYVRKQEDYLRILPRRDVIEWQLDETLDINGWDIQKAMLLLLKSNPTLFEWANSPIVYQTTEQWESLKEIINRYFSSKSGVYHYLNMAKHNYREYLKADQVKQKKYLYVLRPILACRWILRTQTPPPMEFESLVHAELESELLPLVMQLLENKRKSSEMEAIVRVQPLNDYIEKQLETLQIAVVSMPKETHHDTDLLNEHFREIVLSDIRNRHLVPMNGRDWIDFVFRNALTHEEIAWLYNAFGRHGLLNDPESLLEVTKAMIAAGMDPNQLITDDCPNRNCPNYNRERDMFDIPLLSAIGHSEDAPCAESIKYLLEHGADPNALYIFGEPSWNVFEWYDENETVNGPYLSKSSFYGLLLCAAYGGRFQNGHNPFKMLIDAPISIFKDYDRYWYEYEDSIKIGKDGLTYQSRQMYVIEKETGRRVATYQ